MALNLAERAQPATRLRLVYRINSGAIAGANGASAAADKINAAWLDEGGRIPAYMVTRATTPEPGGAVGSGALGIVTAVTGRSDWFSVLDIKTDATLPSVTYDQLLSPMKRIPLGWILGADVRADLDHADLVSSTSPAAVAPAAQQRASRTAADASRADDPLPKVADLLGKLVIGLVAVAAVVLVIVAVRKG